MCSVVLTVVLGVVTIGGLRLFFGSVLDNAYHKDKIIAGMHLLRTQVPATVHRTPPPAAPAEPGLSSLERIRTRDTMRVGYLPDYLPHAELVVLKSTKEFFETRGEELDAFVYSAEAGSAWTLLYPAYSVAIPQPDILAAPLAYPVAHGERELADFLNLWIELKREDRTIPLLYDYWILGKNAVPKQPRWSVIRSVLH